MKEIPGDDYLLYKYDEELFREVRKIWNDYGPIHFENLIESENLVC